MIWVMNLKTRVRKIQEGGSWSVERFVCVALEQILFDHLKIVDASLVLMANASSPFENPHVRFETRRMIALQKGNTRPSRDTRLNLRVENFF